MKAIVYARCSTDENRQDVEVQLKELRRYCEHQKWDYEEEFEYGSGYKGDQPILQKIIEKIKLGSYDVFLVGSMDRFSREHPRKVDELLNRITYDYKCRFISLSDSIDSADEIRWHIMRHLMTYFANVYSRKLSESIKNGIVRAKEKGTYTGGRRKKKVDLERLKSISQQGKLSLRTIAEEYSRDLPKNERISYQQVRRLLQK